jgi:hypothetical protein
MKTGTLHATATAYLPTHAISRLQLPTRVITERPDRPLTIGFHSTRFELANEISIGGLDPRNSQNETAGENFHGAAKTCAQSCDGLVVARPSCHDMRSRQQRLPPVAERALQRIEERIRSTVWATPWALGAATVGFATVLVG